MRVTQVEPCNGLFRQQWQLLSNGTLMSLLPDTAFCMETGGKTNVPDDVYMTDNCTVPALSRQWFIEEVPQS